MDPDPVISSNTKARVSLACPSCGMSLKKAPQGGVIRGTETFCCDGCANGTGCTCSSGIETRKSFNRPGNVGKRNAENRPGDANDNQERDTSGRVIGEGRKTTARRYKSRAESGRGGQRDPRSMRLKSQNKQRDSSREQARGRSEERGQMGKRGGHQRTDRISRTGTKGK
jgi:hypothetical protein